MMNCKDCEGHGWNEDTRGNMIVCKRCAGTGITLHPGDLAALAAANGYVKVDPPITSKHDPRLGIKKPEPWHIDVDALAKSAGYIKLEPGQVVVQVEDLTRIVTWFRGDARTVPHTDMDTTLNRFTAAIDAAKGEWK